jgi:hypothetical protein
MVERGPFIIFLVNARHLDYGRTDTLLQTMAKHPSDGSKNSDVGHAWIYMKWEGGEFEGGFSAETGVIQPTYLHGVSLLAERGDANPACYLFCRQKDGHLQQGSGGHRPTYAAKVDITEAQAKAILACIDTYPYEDYALSGKSCATFVQDIAKCIGIDLCVEQTLFIDQEISFRGERIRMWEDDCWSMLRVATPDRLERSLIELVAEGRAEEALRWFTLKR